MKIVKITTPEELFDLYNCSAMTWEGLSPKSWAMALDSVSEKKVGYVISGKTMNKLCRLTGTNAYKDNLCIFSIKDFGKKLAIMYGARWMDDVIDNNARNENWHPFKNEF